MGRILMSGASGGVRSDDVTASKDDVIKGKKTITTDSDDEVVEGTLPDITVNVNPLFSAMDTWGYYMDFEKGAYRRSGLNTGAGGRVYEAIERVRNNIGATDPAMWRTHATIAGQKGTIQDQAALTLNPGTTAKTGAVSGKYMTGNVVVPAINIPAAYIKKGQRITFPDGSSIVGTFEGWVPVATDLYYNGQNVAGFEAGSASTQTGLSFDNNQMTIKSSTVIILKSTKTYDVRSYSKFILEGNFIGSSNGTNITIKPNNGQGNVAFRMSGTQSQIIIDIAALTSLTSGWSLHFGEASGTIIGGGSYIRRIRLG